MKTSFDRIVMTVIALALSIIALNPWVSPGRVGASGISEVNIAMVDGSRVSSRNPLPVKVVN